MLKLTGSWKLYRPKRLFNRSVGRDYHVNSILRWFAVHTDFSARIDAKSTPDWNSLTRAQRQLADSFPMHLFRWHKAIRERLRSLDTRYDSCLKVC